MTNLCFASTLEPDPALHPPVFDPTIHGMTLSAFRYIRIRKMVLGVLATIWLALALHPCAMAYANDTSAAGNDHHDCPHCPKTNVLPDDDCELSKWQQNHATPPPLAFAFDNGQIPVALVESFVALALWQPEEVGPPSPLLNQPLFHRPPPLTRQDQLRL